MVTTSVPLRARMSETVDMACTPLRAGGRATPQRLLALDCNIVPQISRIGTAKCRIAREKTLDPQFNRNLFARREGTGRVTASRLSSASAACLEVQQEEKQVLQSHAAVVRSG